MQGTTTGGIEETKSSARDHLSRRDCLPPELGRPSLSESTTGAPSKKLSPQFDRRSSCTKEDVAAGGGGDFFEDSNKTAAGFHRFNQRAEVFHGGGAGSGLS